MKKIKSKKGKIKMLKVCDEKKKNSFRLFSCSLFSDIKIYYMLYIMLYTQS